MQLNHFRYVKSLHEHIYFIWLTVVIRQTERSSKTDIPSIFYRIFLNFTLSYLEWKQKDKIARKQEGRQSRWYFAYILGDRWRKYRVWTFHSLLYWTELYIGRAVLSSFTLYTLATARLQQWERASGNKANITLLAVAIVSKMAATHTNTAPIWPYSDKYFVLISDNIGAVLGCTGAT